MTEPPQEQKQYYLANQTWQYYIVRKKRGRESMMTGYKTRQIEVRLRSFAAHFKAVLVLGARQVGKSTLLAYFSPT